MLCLWATRFTWQQYYRIMLSSCIVYKITERLRGWQRCSTAISVITHPSTTSDIDQLILTELIINMTGSCNKGKRSCTLSKQKPTLWFTSRGRWLGEWLPFICVALPSPKWRSFIHVAVITHSVSPCCWQQCAYQKVAFLRDYGRSCNVPNGNVGKKKHEPVSCIFLCFIFFGEKDTGALAERCDVSRLWICQVAVKKRERERIEARAKLKEKAKECR